MARRIDFYDDPSAPEANSLVPSVNVVVTNPAGEVLLIRRSDNDNWAVPGGAIDLGESLAQAAVRETREETGIDCEVTGLVGIYSDPRHVILYTSNGEVDAAADRALPRGTGWHAPGAACVGVPPDLPTRACSGHAEGPGWPGCPPSPAWRALTTASVRVLTPSLASTAETWLRTVLRLSTKWSAM